ncbi:right-handed parallel beta-helix repeat-containing protein, partial [uncultured Amaricoccus sp.]|uniref:right-handed parallel beta-helix repeat-containing protein n=1 Tax=uncultured Amaricoccus sp. TaxID=339341 RepID=UPI00262554C6
FKSAKAGDVLSLAGGNYGTVTLASGKSGVTIKSASDSSQAVFKNLTVSKATNFTIDNVKFDGPGGNASGGLGLKINYSTNVKVVNSDFFDYKFGSFIYEIKGLTVSNNTYTRMWEDAMNFTDIQGGVISNNIYRESGSQPGYSHKDFIQFWTNAGYDQAASKNIQITGNKLYAKDGQTHGIFVMNEWHGQKYENITIANNYLQSSQTHGITVNYGNNVNINNNTLIKDGKGYPVINVTPDSTNVKITNNTSPSIPDQGNSTWYVANNKETGGTNYHYTNGLSGSPVKNVGSTAGSSTTAGSSSASPAVVDTPSTPNTPSTGASSSGNNVADDFVFKGASSAGKTSTLSMVDFSEKDEIVFTGYDANTFKDKNGGNEVWHSLDGTYVRADSIADLQELVTYSEAVKAKVSGDTLTLTIDQKAGTHTLVLAGLGSEYQDSFDATLF